MTVAPAPRLLAAQQGALLGAVLRTADAQALQDWSRWPECLRRRIPDMKARRDREARNFAAIGGVGLLARGNGGSVVGRGRRRKESCVSAGKTTIDHEVIRKWAEKRKAVPASVEGTEHGEEDAGILRFDFKPTDAKLHPVDWDAFFDKFEESKLAFLYQEKTADGKVSRFHKFIRRD